MPYLKVAKVGRSNNRWTHTLLFQGIDAVWSKPYHAGEKAALTAERAKIANGSISAPQRIGARRRPGFARSFCLAPTNCSNLPASSVYSPTPWRGANACWSRTASSFGTRATGSAGKSRKRRQRASPMARQSGRKARSCPPTTVVWWCFLHQGKWRACAWPYQERAE